MEAASRSNRAGQAPIAAEPVRENEPRPAPAPPGARTTRRREELGSTQQREASTCGPPNGPHLAPDGFKGEA